MLLKFWRHLQLILRPLPARDDVFADYDRTRQFYIMQQVIQHYDRRLDDPAPLLNQTVLDIGCGLSTVSEFLVLSGAEVTAIDQDAAVIEAAKKKAETYGTDVAFIHSSVNDIVHTGQTYDVIVCLDVLEYITDLDKFLWVIKRLLKADGVLIFSTISRRPLAWLIHIFMSAWVYRRTPRGSRHYKNFATSEQMQTALAKQSFELTHTQGLSFNPQDKTWQLSDTITTRYLAAAKLN